MQRDNFTFSQKHPFIFGMGLIFLAVVVFFGAMAFFYKIKGHFPFFKRPNIGIVQISGTITSSRKIINWIDELKENSSIKGVLIRINSPGGIVAPSQEIYEAVRELSKKKPTVVSMGAIAASGAYYISCGARLIVANPGTITGSIGVLASLTSVKKLADKVGIEDETITSGKLKAAGSPLRTLSPAEKKYFQGLVDNLFHQFVNAVALGRHMKVERVLALADGRAYTGLQAKELGLVDKLGNMDASLEFLKKMCHIEGKTRLLWGPEEKVPLIKKILGVNPIKPREEMGNFYFIYPPSLPQGGLFSCIHYLNF